MKIRNVIFDLDGTLVDSLDGIAWSIEKALGSAGIAPPAADLRPVIGPPIRQILSAVSGVVEPVLLDRLEQRFRQSYDSEGWRRTTCQPGVPDLLWGLITSGIDLWLVTNKPAQATSQILDSLKIGCFFRETVSPDSGPSLRAGKAGLLADLITRRRLERATTLMVGDTAEDSRAARSAGIACAIVSHGYAAAPPEPESIPIAAWSELEEICRLGVESALLEASER